MERKLALFVTRGKTNWWFVNIVIILATGSITFLFDRFLDAQKSYSFNMPSETMASPLQSMPIPMEANPYLPPWCLTNDCQDQADTSPAGGRAADQARPSPKFTWLRVILPTGVPAPDLDLQALVGNAKFRLSSYRNVKPVVLVFGSFTCNLFQNHIPELNRLHKQFENRAAFVFIAAPEAGHTISGFEFLLQDRANNPMRNELKHRERVEQARAKAGLDLPGFFDGPNYEASQAYRAWPGRLVLVDVEGHVANDFRTPIQGWSAGTIAPRLETICSMAESKAADR